MKALILILLTLPSVTFSQDAPKLTNTIIVKGVAFSAVVNSLLDSAFKVDKMDKEYQTIKTEYRELCKGCAPEISLSVRVKDSTATITGTWRSNTGIALFGLKSERAMQDAYVFPVQMEKSRVPRKAFEMMVAFAKSLGGVIEYAKQ